MRLEPLIAKKFEMKGSEKSRQSLLDDEEMEKYRGIPQGFMTVGEVARKVDITVRTLQSYEREGLLAASAYWEVGRRL